MLLEITWGKTNGNIIPSSIENMKGGNMDNSKRAHENMRYSCRDNRLRPAKKNALTKKNR